MAKLLTYRVPRHPKYKNLTFTPQGFDAWAAQQKPSEQVRANVRVENGKYSYKPSAAYLHHLSKHSK